MNEKAGAATVTSSNRVQLAPCYLLHLRPYRETSNLIDVFSRDYGRISLVAKGVRRKKSALAGVLRPFAALQLSWLGKNELKTLVNAELLPNHHVLQNKSLYCGFYLNELLLNLLYPEDPYPELFDLYAETLIRLSFNERLDVSLRYFELALLESLGYAPLPYDDISSDESIDPSAHYYCDPEMGLQRVSKADVRTISGEAVLAFLHARLDDPTHRREVRCMMRQLLAHHLGGKELKSRQFFANKK